MADQKIIRKFSAETKALEDTRSVIVTISTASPDRDGDIVVPKGGDFANFLKNPVVLFGHQYDQPPIAKAEELVVGEDDIKAKVTFPKEGVYAFADAIYGLIKAGIMHAWSIGFQADMNQSERLPGGGLQFNSWELLEFSAVPVPANADALTIVRSVKGLSTEQIEEVTEAPEPDEVTTLKQTIAALETQVHDLTTKLAAVEATEATDHAAAIRTALTELRDSLKPADKEIGLVLRSLKSLLEQPSK